MSVWCVLKFLSLTPEMWAVRTKWHLATTFLNFNGISGVFVRQNLRDLLKHGILIKFSDENLPFGSEHSCNTNQIWKNIFIYLFLNIKSYIINFHKYEYICKYSLYNAQNVSISLNDWLKVKILVCITF